MQDGKRARLYCCHSLLTRDALDELHVLSVGVDLLAGAGRARVRRRERGGAVAESCRRGGDGKIPAEAAANIRAASQVLNIAWIADALDSQASVICPSSGACPRQPRCGVPARSVDSIQMRDQGSLREMPGSRSLFWPPFARVFEAFPDPRRVYTQSEICADIFSSSMTIPST